MPYAFQLRDDSLQSALRRIAEEELSAVAGHLSLADDMDHRQVHDTRKRIKKLRSLLRLLRSGFDDFRTENAALRDVAAGLSGTRDRTVLMTTFDTLMDPAQRRPDVAALREAVSLTAITLPETDPSAAVAALRARASLWTIDRGDNDLLRRGLAETRRRGRLAMRHARQSPTDEAFHDWRKRAKDLWYQSRLLVAIWPDLMKPVVAAADILGESLGNHHDLSVLNARLADVPRDLATDDARADLLRRIDEAQTAIAVTAFPLSARLFAGDPDEIAAQWVAWWKIWQRQAAS